MAPQSIFSIYALQKDINERQTCVGEHVYTTKKQQSAALAIATTFYIELPH